ncbi:beta-propeller domain-containing protein [Bacillus sp. AGMB 02131]|uniref:Beta-propeller domain-containing protein n=1 Tax=Peribacillus faecalis TaxID=2772559 RepID=A0A927HA76_9BACI|nr:beta-propeller domain-containing protein [Peribacillus faecalis]MBD3107151.1 beta-propeller domain-containing protein [Peribacillus faecalis]
MKKWWAVAGIGALAVIGVLIYSYGTTSVNNVSAFSKMMANQAITVSFSNPIYKSSISEKHISVKDQAGNVIPVTYSINDDARTLVIKPKENYYLQEGKYVLELSNRIMSRFGLPLSGEKLFSFRVYTALPVIESEEELRAILLADLEEEKYVMMKEDAKMESSDTSNDYSETNVQVEGIDEGDIVKTDGQYIYSSNHENVFITDAKSMEHAATIPFDEEDNPQAIFLQDDRLTVISQKYAHSIFSEDKSVMPNSYMTIKIFDVTNKEEPVQLKEIGVEGDYRTSRLYNSHMYVIASQYPDVWILREAKDDAAFVPRYFDSESGTHKQKLDKIQYVPKSKDRNYMHLLAIDLGTEQIEYNIETILGSGENVYMSYENLYLAANYYDLENERASTQVYKYAIDGLNMTYHSLGEVKGSIINQFAMDEHEGNFRIATTIQEKQLTNSLSVLDENMQIIGELNGLAKDERIYSVRYMGDKAYIVTFKEVDPLFVIDTSDPAKPAVLGELKVPGYSNYLHFHDENHLIGFGFDTKLIDRGNGESFVENKGMKISLFDISDFHHPKEKDSVIIGGAGTSSDLIHDHKALFQQKDKHLYGFPISVYESSEPFHHKFIMNGALIYEITPENGIKLKATIKNDGDKEEEIDWENSIRRMIYIDDEIYTISNKTIKSYRLEDYSKGNEIELKKR